MLETAHNDHEYHSAMLPENQDNWGFRIEELNSNERIQRPIREVMLGRVEMAHLAEQMAHDGAVQLLEPQDGKGDNLYVTIGASEFEAKGLGGEYRGKFYYKPDEITDPELQSYIASRERDALLERAAKKVESNLDNEHLFIPGEFFYGVETVSQVFEVDNGREGFRIINFSQTPIEGRNLQQMMNAFREMDQLTGGQSSDDVSVVAIFPETLSYWQDPGAESAGIGAKKTVATASGGGAIMLNEALLKENSAEVNDPNEKKLTVIGDSIEATLFHELTHVIESRLIPRGATLPSEKFGWDIPRNQSGTVDFSKKPTFVGNVLNPSEYGRVNHREDVAESSAAMFAGGEWSSALDEQRRQAIAELYESRHSGVEGPSYLRCREVNLAELDNHKIGSKLKEPAQLRPVFVYTIDQKA